MSAETVRGVVALAVCGALACGGGGSAAGVGGSGGGAGVDGGGGFAGEGGGAPAAAGTDGNRADAGSCNRVPIGEAPLVTEIVTQGTPPARPAGGTIVGGTYYVTSETFYLQPTCTYVPGDPARRAVLVTVDSTGSGRMAIAAATESEDAHWAIDYAIEGTSLSTTPRCSLSGVELAAMDGGSSTKISGFTATPTQIVFFNDAYCGTGVDVLTKQ
jgi:hypothetical protein